MTGQTDNLHAAVMAVEITPPIGTPLDGYGARKGYSTDVHDPLFATLLFLKTGDRGAALVTFDLLAVTLGFTSRLRKILSPVLGIPEEAVLVCAIHTHSGPAGFLGRAPLLNSAEDPILQEICLRQLAGAAAKITRQMQPARLSLGSGSVAEIGRNRNDPVAGLNDGEVIVLRVDLESGQPLAVFVNYGCHPTVLGPDNLSVSADFPGAARTALKRIYPAAEFLFSNGATGDVSTRFTRRGQGFDEVDRMGRILAGEVLKVMQVCTPLKDEHLSGQVGDVTLSYRQFPTRANSLQQLAELESSLHRLRSSSADHGEIRKAVTKVEGAQAQLAMIESYAGISAVTTQVQVLRIGDLILLGLPGEPFTRTVLNLKAHDTAKRIAVISYANDYRGYFPDVDAVKAGTYEALISPFDSAASEVLSQAVLALI